MPTAVINGVKLNFELHGESGPPLVLVHGYTGDITDWRLQLPAFAPSFRILIADNRGHGQSEAPSDRSVYTVDQMAADIEALTAELGLERFHLLGHSMGGAVAQEIALNRPERLLSLTLHNTTNIFSVANMNPASRCGATGASSSRRLKAWARWPRWSRHSRRHPSCPPLAWRRRTSDWRGCR